MTTSIDTVLKDLKEELVNIKEKDQLQEIERIRFEFVGSVQGISEDVRDQSEKEARNALLELAKDEYYRILVIEEGITLFSEFTGNHLLGVILLGVLVPDRPPMGSSLLDKLGYIHSALFFPCYVISIGHKFNLSVIRHEAVINVSVLIEVASLGKLLAVMIPSLYYNMPLKDSLSLGLLLNCQGFFDIYIYERSLYFKV
ncbi:hypothetical protein QQ045_018190 [Rhodiola kirilowii]